MEYACLVKHIADILKDYDSGRPVHKLFLPGVGPFGEPQLVAIIADKLNAIGITAIIKRTPDLEITDEWAVEFKIVRPFGNNGKEAENWSVNMLHPYPGNVSLIGDANKLLRKVPTKRKGLFVIGFEHEPARISLDPLLKSFELICREVMDIKLSERFEEKRKDLIHPEHQVLRCIGWEVYC